MKVIRMSKIPVFVSCPTHLNEEQELKRKVIIGSVEILTIKAKIKDNKNSKSTIIY